MGSVNSPSRKKSINTHPLPEVCLKKGQAYDSDPCVLALVPTVITALKDEGSLTIN